MIARAQSLRAGFFVRELDHLVETLAIFLAWDPRFQVLILLSGEHTPGGEHEASLRRLRELPQIRLLHWQDATEPLDVLFIDPRTAALRRDPATRRWLAEGAQLHVLNYDGYEGLRWKGRWRREAAQWRFLFRARHVLRQEKVSRARDLALRRVAFFAPYVHPQYLTRAAVLSQFEKVAQRRNEVRRFGLGFMGNREPAHRTAILREIRQELAAEDCQLIESPEAAVRSGSDAVLWMETGHGEGQPQLPAIDYLAALEQVDFILCPPGWGAWTHRAVEALVAGAIPILENEGSYNRGLQDGINCIGVRRGNWIEAVRRARGMRKTVRQALRQNIYALRDAQLMPAVAAQECVRSLGW